MAHPSPDLYGSDRVLLETVSGYVERAYQVVVVLPAEGPLGPALVERGAEVRFLSFPVLRKSLLSPRGLITLVVSVLGCLPRMLRLMRVLRPTIALVNTVTIPVWILAARIARVPVVCHVHEAEQSAKPIVRKVLYLPLLAATGLIVNSRFSLNVLTQSWPSLGRRSRVVYNGVPAPTEPTPPLEKLNGRFRLLFLGRLSPRKGPQVAVDALRLLVEDGRDARLQLLGAVYPGYEWFQDQLTEQVRVADMESRVEFLGFDPDIWARIAQCDIVLVPSTVDEPFGNTAVEAMLAERPLVVSATSGLREASAGYRTARQVIPGDAQAIAEAVIEMVDHWEAVVQYSEADRDLALQRHAPSVYQARIVTVVNQLVHPRERHQ